MIEITFEDVISGIIDFSKYLNYCGVFKYFNDINYCFNFKINPELGTIVWENDLDIAPDTLCSQVRNEI